MATILAQASGNWSATGTWTGGVVPNTGDIAVATNSYVINLDIPTITCASIRNDATGGGTQHGSFTPTVSNLTLNCSVYAGNFDSCLNLNGGAATVLNGDITGGSNNNTSGVTITGGSLSITGTIYGGTHLCSGLVMSGGTVTANAVYGGAGDASGTGVNISGGTLNCTTVTGYNNALGGGYGIVQSGGVVTCTTVLSAGGNATNGGASISGGIFNCTTATVNSTSSGPAINQTGGNCNIYEVQGNGYGPSGSGNNIATVSCTNAGLMAVKKITFGPLGQCPISGNVRLVPDVTVTAPFFIPLNSDFPSAGSGTNPAVTTQTTLSNQVAGVIAEMMRTE